MKDIRDISLFIELETWAYFMHKYRFSFLWLVCLSHSFPSAIMVLKWFWFVPPVWMDSSFVLYVHSFGFKLVQWWIQITIICSYCKKHADWNNVDTVNVLSSVPHYSLQSFPNSPSKKQETQIHSYSSCNRLFLMYYVYRCIYVCFLTDSEVNCCQL